MADKSLALRQDWTLKKFFAWVAVRSVFTVGKGMVYVARTVIRAPADFLFCSCWLLERSAPGIRKWAQIAGVLIDRGFDSLDSWLDKALYVVDAMPFGGQMVPEEAVTQIDGRVTQSRELSPLLQLPTEDITRAIASYDGSVLIACRSGAGKTTTMLSAIAHAGDCDFWIFDGKGSAWNGLEKNPERYFLCNHPDLIPRALEGLTHLVTVVMRGRQDTRLANGGTHPSKPQRIIVICDEFNNVVTFAEMVKLHNDLCNLITLLINMGREDLMNWWGVAQTHLVGEINLSTGVQKSLAFACQGRDTQYQSIEGALCDRNIVPNPDERKRLQDQLAHYTQTQADQSQPICFTTIGGKRLVRLPALSQDRDSSSLVPQPASRQLHNPETEIHTKPKSVLNGHNNGHGIVSPLVSIQSEKIAENYPETTQNQGFQPPETNFSSTSTGGSSALLLRILAAFQDQRSDDWIAKNIVMAEERMGYRKARERVESLRQIWESRRSD